MRNPPPSAIGFTALPSRKKGKKIKRNKTQGRIYKGYIYKCSETVSLM